MKLRKDGSPISSNSLSTNSSQREQLSPSDITKLLRLSGKANEVHLATVREVYYVDDIKNQSKYQVEYRVRIEFGDRHGQEYESVTALNLYGGMVNFSEIVYQPKEQIIKGNLDAEQSYMFDHDGSQVVVAFMDGYPNRPFIVGGWNHTNNDVFASKKADGIRKIEEFNGMRLETNKDGEYVLTYLGGKRNTKTKKTINAATAPTTFKFSKDGSWQIDDKENQKIKISRASKTIEISQSANVKPDEEYGKTDSSAPGAMVNSIILDKAGKKITLAAGTDKIVQVWDGTSQKLTITMGAVVVTYDTAAQKVNLKAGATEINIDGNSGKIELKGNLVDVGTGASALAVLGPQLISWLASHTHLGDGAAIPPAPTSPPLVPPPSSLLSTTVKIKS